MITKKPSVKTIKMAVLIAVASSLVFNFPSIAAQAASPISNGYTGDGYNDACQPGSYVAVTVNVNVNGFDCQICPPSTYSDSTGAEFCEPCLDTIYNEGGANSAELLNGNLYCVNTEEMYDTDDELLNQNTMTDAPTTLQIAIQDPSASPTRMESSMPSNLPSTIPSVMPSSIEEDSNDPSGEIYRFEWHGRYRECPGRYEAMLFPFLVVTLLVLLVTLLEYLLPSCHTALVWWGVEYFQMMYLIGNVSIPWSPIAEFVFTRLLPIFALDLNASFSVQCIVSENWPQQEAADHLFMLSLPLIFAIILIFLARISGNRLVRDESVSRWMTLVLHMGYLKLVIASLQVLQLPKSWAADDLSSYTKSDPFYATVGGLAGLLFYGIVFPFWFVQSLSHYNRLNLALAKVDAPIGSSAPHEEHAENEERKRRLFIKRKQIKRKKELFMTLGIFPTTLGPNAWWWPGFWMLRKLLFAVLLVVFPNTPVLLLVVFLMILFLGIIIQQYSLPLAQEQNEQTNGQKKNWYHVVTVDTVLQFCLAAMIGMSFFSLWTFGDDGSTRSFFQKQTEGSLVLSILLTSSIYLALAIGVCCARSEPRFMSVASQIVVNSNSNISNNNHRNNTFASTNNGASIAARGTKLCLKRTFSTESSSPRDSRKEIEFYGDVHWNTNANLTDEEYGAQLQDETVNCGFVTLPPYFVGGEDGEQEGCKEKQHTMLSSQSRPGIFRCDSSIATNEEEDDMMTVFEEVWVDEDTGKEITDPKQGIWMDPETGMPAVPQID